jgi:hypothetical protein
VEHVEVDLPLSAKRAARRPRWEPICCRLVCWGVGAVPAPTGIGDGFLLVSEQFTVDELNDIFAGVVRFTNAQGREVEEY